MERAAALVVMSVIVLAMSSSGCLLPWWDEEGREIYIVGFNDERAYFDEQAIVGMGPRLSGTDAEHQVAGYIRDRFLEAGLSNVHIEWYNVTCYEVNSASFSLVIYDQTGREDEKIEYEHLTEFVLQGYSGSRDWDDRLDDLEIVDVGDGTDESAYEDVDGKAVLVTSEGVASGNLTFTDLFVRAWENGAAANIVQNVHIHEELDYPPIAFTASVGDRGHWKPLPDDYPEGQGPDIPSFMVSKEAGDEIRSRLANQFFNPVTGESNVKVRIDFDVTVEMRPLNVVIGDVKGTEDGIVMLGAHHDTVYVTAGAVDNTCGVATLVEIARNLADEQPKRTIRLATWGGEEEAILGSWEYLQAHPDLMDNLTVYCNLDMVNVDLDRGTRVTIGANDEGVLGGLKEVQRAVVDRYEWARKYEFRYYTSNLTHGSDQATFAIEGGKVAVYWGSGGLEYHTPQDTILHVSQESLMLCGLIYGSYALMAANA